MPTITALGVPHSALAPVWLLRQIILAILGGFAAAGLGAAALAAATGFAGGAAAGAGFWQAASVSRQAATR